MSNPFENSFRRIWLKPAIMTYYSAGSVELAESIFSPHHGAQTSWYRLVAACAS
jgi:hypothetical protein